MILNLLVYEIMMGLFQLFTPAPDITLSFESNLAGPPVLHVVTLYFRVLK